MLFAHLSDTHISSGPLGAEPAQGAADALLRVQAMSPRPAFVLITGDLIDHGTAEEYQVARSVLERIDVRVHVLPGNHDHAPTMLDQFRDTGWVHPAPEEPRRCYYRVDYPDLTLLCCDSSVPGRHDGELGAEQLRWLDSQLSAGSDRPVLVAMHHHPVPSGITAMDELMLRDAADLADVLTRHPPVHRLLAGHLHRTLTTTFASTVVTSAPSTYRQVHLNLTAGAPGAFVAEPAGFLLHHVEPTRTVTHSVYVHHTGAPFGRI